MEVHLNNNHNRVDIFVGLNNTSENLLKREIVEKHIERLNEVIKNILFLIVPKGNIKFSEEDKKGLIIDIRQ